MGIQRRLAQLAEDAERDSRAPVPAAAQSQPTCIRALVICAEQGVHRPRIKNWPGDGMSEVPGPAAPPGRRRTAGDSVMTAAGRASGPGGAVPWPRDLARRLAEIRDITAPGMESAAPLAGTLAVECLPAIRFLARGCCRGCDRPGLVRDAGQDAFFDVLRELRSGAGRRGILPYLGQVVRNAVSRCITAVGGLYPTAGQRRRASIARALGLFLDEHGRLPSGTELPAARHRLMSSRSGARDQAALAFLEEVRVYMAGEEPFFADDVSGTGPRPADSRLRCPDDHVDADLALDPLDPQRLISLTAAACRDLRPGLTASRSPPPS